MRKTHFVLLEFLYWLSSDLIALESHFDQGCQWMSILTIIKECDPSLNIQGWYFSKDDTIRRNTNKRYNTGFAPFKFTAWKWLKYQNKMLIIVLQPWTARTFFTFPWFSFNLFLVCAIFHHSQKMISCFAYFQWG